MNWVGTAAKMGLAYGSGSGNARYNATANKLTGAAIERQGLEEESTVRQAGAAELGRERAAIAQAGGGSGGDVGRMYAQSAVSAELDALRTRYKAQLQGWGYRTQGKNILEAGSDAATAGKLRAASVLLRSYSGY